MTNIKRILFSLLALGALAATPSYARCLNQLQQQPDPQQGGLVTDPVRELNLSPEQRERIRAIREEMREQRAAINRRLREKNLALEELLDSDNPSEALVEQRLRDVAESQAASVRMRVLTEVRIRRVLTSEQLNTLRTLRQNASSFGRDRQLDRNNGRRREGTVRQNGYGLPNKRNGLGPLLRRRGDASRKQRP